MLAEDTQCSRGSAKVAEGGSYGEIAKVIEGGSTAKAMEGGSYGEMDAGRRQLRGEWTHLFAERPQRLVERRLLQTS